MSRVSHELTGAVDAPGVLKAERAESSTAGRGEAASETSLTTFTPPTDREIRRRVRLRRRQRSSGWLIGETRRLAGLAPDAPRGVTAADPEWVRPPRLARCRWRVGGAVGVHAAPGQTAHFSGTERCGSIWGCPVCSAVIRSGRSQEISEAVTAHREAGGSLLFMTMTLRHHQDDALELTLKAAQASWSKLVSGTAWLRQKKRLSIRGYVRATEVTLGVGPGANGWHPHIHSLIFVDKELEDSAVEDFRRWCSDRWALKVTQMGARTPSDERGVTIQKVQDGAVLASYLSKVQEKGLGLELARSDLKSGRAASINPLDLLDYPHGDVWARSLWLEYTEATRGCRAITWSRDIRRELGLVVERTDEELLEDVSAKELLASINADLWDAKKSDPVWLALILETAERFGAEGLPAAIRAVRVADSYIDLTTGQLFYLSDSSSALTESPEAQKEKNDVGRNSGQANFPSDSPQAGPAGNSGSERWSASLSCHPRGAEDWFDAGSDRSYSSGRPC